MKRVITIAAAMLLGVGTLAPSARAQNIVELAQAANAPGGAYEGQFDTLIAALLAADPAVVETLSGNGKFTVFAPVDAAFEELDLTPANVGTAFSQSVLTEILQYHVVRGNRFANSVTRARQLRTLHGDFLMVDGAQLTDNVGRTASIVVTDIEASNGVIHAIDQVVLPFMP